MAIQDDQQDFLGTITKDFKRLQGQKAKFTGGIESRVLLNLAFVLGEHYTVAEKRALFSKALDPNKLYLVFNVIAQRLSKLIGRLNAIAPVFKAKPNKRDPKSFAGAEIVDRLIVALDQKVDQPSRMREVLFWMGVGGTACEYVPWVPNASFELAPQFSDTNELLFKDLQPVAPNPDGSPTIVPQSVMEQQVSAGRPREGFDVYEIAEPVGDVESEIHGPLTVFVDQSVKSIKELAPDQAVYLAYAKTHGWIEENFGEEAIADLKPDTTISIITTAFHQTENASVAGVSLKDMIATVQGSVSNDDPPMNVVVKRFQPPSKKNPRGRYTCFVPGQKILDDDANPYEEIPIVDFHWSPVTVSFWTKDYVTDLIAPQRFLNKRMSQLGEQSNASIYDKILLGPNLTEKDIPADYPGCVKNGVTEQGQPLAVRLPGPQLPGWFMQSIDLVSKLLNDMAGGADLFQESKFPGQLRGPMAVPMLQEILDTEWGPLYEHLGQRLSMVKQMRVNRVKQFYPPIRTMHYLDRNQRDEVFDFHTEEILKSGTNYNVTVERGSLVPELRALREARIRERLGSPLGILYTDPRTGQLDRSKIAQDLQFGDEGREDRESQYRTLAGKLIARIWQGQTLPPVLPFWDHGSMMDELEHAMATTEFLEASPPIQQLFFDRWKQHNDLLQQAAQQQQQAMQGQQMQSAIAQATQMAAAKAASETVDQVFQQMHAQQQQAPETAQAIHQSVTAQQQMPPRVQ